MLADPWAGRSSIVSLSRSSSLLLLRPGQWQSHHQSAQSFVYSIDFYIVVCIIVLVASRDALIRAAFSVGALRMHLLRGIPREKKTDRYLCTIASCGT